MRHSPPTQIRSFWAKTSGWVHAIQVSLCQGAKYPVLSPRDDIVVIVDEAHRTQYKSLAENMRAGLPNASYLAFTGTPLLGRDRKPTSGLATMCRNTPFNSP
ncbi:DEAD/DEAH box helicase family protein [Rhodoferax sp.]|uniref:DEAD/DEAH box helicase family protein n=1 Tax=Rhodoferax sp. TaxID=50421 RepID=UPI002ACE34FA|nr:DEAD/DEAH box helicase family protein [Rhodoferax sp.]MDZ7921383.1 DEAD/DEAH box helicase family protein [Rhodoferax sp.]